MKKMREKIQGWRKRMENLWRKSKAGKRSEGG